jgi:tetratricopeptide (TPR) repeat protein
VRLFPFVVCLSAVIPIAAQASQAIWIDVPFVPQPREGCGSASLSMLMQYWAQQQHQPAPAASDVDAIQRRIYSPSKHGILASSMQDYLRQNGYQVFALNGQWTDLESNRQKGRPLIVALRPLGQSELHYVVVDGIDPPRGLVMMNDPAQRKLLSQERAAFEKDWSATGHWMLLAVPALTLFGVFLGACAVSASAQCSPSPDPRIQTLFQQQNWNEVVRLAQPMPARSPDLNFAYGMALAHLNRLVEARATLLAGARQCPTQKRFPIELAGVAFEQKQYPAAAGWLRRALRLDPHDPYANNFLATVYFLSGNLPAALQYWNRIQKPSIATLDLDSHLRVRRLLLDRAFAFSPAAVLRDPQLLTTETRLNALGIFPNYDIHLAPALTAASMASSARRNKAASAPVPSQRSFRL